MRSGCDVERARDGAAQHPAPGFVAEKRTQTAGTTTAGGYTVPKELANEIVRVMKDFGPMYDPGVTREIVTSSGNEFDIPTNDDTANSAAALAEGATSSTTTAATWSSARRASTPTSTRRRS
jgi:HK97 family phage major capsid protein